MSKNLTSENSELTNLIATARMGFSVVPVGINHAEKGVGLLYMNGEGLRFEPTDGKEPLILTWGEFDKGPASEYPVDSK